MDDPEFQTGAVFCPFLHVGTNFAHFNVRESEKLQETVGAGQDSCPKKSKAESGSRLRISNLDNKELLADQAWRLCGFMVH